MGGSEGPRLLREKKYSPTETLRTSAGGEVRGREVGSGPTASVPRAASKRRAGPAPTAESCRSAPLQGDAIPWILHQQGPADMCFFPLHPPANSDSLPEGGCHKKQETRYCMCTTRVFNC